MSYPTRELADVSSLITKGTTPTTLGHDFSEIGVPFLRAQNLQDGRVDIDADPLYVSPETHQALSRSRIVAGDVLLSIAGTIGRAALVQDYLPEMNCNQAVAIVRPTEEVLPKYLLRWLSSKEAFDQIRKSEVTATISNLSLSQIGALKITLPPLDEQRRIAAILDQADDLRRKRRGTIAHLDRMLAVEFLALFGDPENNPKDFPMRPMEELLAESPNFGSMIPPSKTGGEWLSLRVANIQD